MTDKAENANVSQQHSGNTDDFNEEASSQRFSFEDVSKHNCVFRASMSGRKLLVGQLFPSLTRLTLQVLVRHSRLVLCSKRGQSNIERATIQPSESRSCIAT